VVLVETLKKTDHLEDLEAAGRNIKMHIKEIGYQIVDWIDLALDRG
jgi:hypothetical protein